MLKYSQSFPDVEDDFLRDDEELMDTASLLESASAYLCGSLPRGEAEALQRRLVYDIGEESRTAALLLCEHPWGISIGREGSRAHVRLTDEKLTAMEYRIDYLARGGGTWLHAPGQLAGYLIAPLTTLRLTPAGYVDRLAESLRIVLTEFGLDAHREAGSPLLRIHDRLIAAVGVSIRDQISSFGFVLNVDPDLARFRDVDCEGDSRPMTSIQRECPNRVRPSAVRQRIIQSLSSTFRFGRVSVFHHHPSALPRPSRHAAIPTRR